MVIQMTENSWWNSCNPIFHQLVFDLDLFCSNVYIEGDLDFTLWDKASSILMGTSEGGEELTVEFWVGVTMLVAIEMDCILGSLLHTQFYIFNMVPINPNGAKFSAALWTSPRAGTHWCSYHNRVSSAEFQKQVLFSADFYSRIV